MVRPLKPRSWFWNPPPPASRPSPIPTPKFWPSSSNPDHPSPLQQQHRKRRITLPKTSIQKSE